MFDLWAHQWRRRHAHGDVILTRFADDYIAGFQHREDAERFLSALRDRLAKFGLELHPEKTRLIEFGRFACRDREARGVGKLEPFEFLGFTHACANKSTGWFVLRRHTSKKRMRAKLSEVKTELRRRQHLPIPDQGLWLASVIRGHCNYYGVPGNSDAINAFRDQATGHWYWALKRRSQRHCLNWERMHRIAQRWLPPAHVTHPNPLERFDARAQGRSPVR